MSVLIQCNKSAPMNSFMSLMRECEACVAGDDGKCTGRTGGSRTKQEGDNLISKVRP